MSKKEIGNEVVQSIAKVVAEHIPKEVLYECIEEGVREALQNLRVSEYDVKNYLKAVVEERTKELLRTTFAKEVDALATKAVAQVLAR